MYYGLASLGFLSGCGLAGLGPWLQVWSQVCLKYLSSGARLMGEQLSRACSSHGTGAPEHKKASGTIQECFWSLLCHPHLVTKAIYMSKPKVKE